MKQWIWGILLAGCLPMGAAAQNDDYRLAQQYYLNGEYEKAVVLYEKLYQSQPQTDFYFDRYMETLIALEDFKVYERELKKRIKLYPNKVQLYVQYGEMYERQFEEAKANEQYRYAIDNMKPNKSDVMMLANSFLRLSKLDLALETYRKGEVLLKDSQAFAFEKGDLYRRRGERKLMVESYLSSLEGVPERATMLHTVFQRYFEPDDYKELQAQLYTRIQENPEEIIYTEMLAWAFLQREDYANALRQERALDRRLDENGGRVFRLAQIADRAGDYATAIDAYEYIIEQHGKMNTYYLEAKRESLKCKQKQIVEVAHYEITALRNLEAEYENFLNEFGRNANTAPILFELAELEAFYINDLDKAIRLLEELRILPNLRRHIEARAKLTLGDFYLMKGEIWEATLLYSQVDKAFQEDVLGQTARFKNAQLSYFNGDFEWAQAQFSILKSSTSKLIANDALDLSVFILDNLALDTVGEPMEKYAQAELLAFQNRFDEAFEVLENLQKDYPNHSLEDDIYYAQAQMFVKKRQFERAAEKFEQIIAKDAKSIRADNALFALGDLYETKLKDTAKAQTYFEKIILEYSNSTFAVEARKRYRKLRGDVQ